MAEPGDALWLGAASGLGRGHGWMGGWWGDAGKRCGLAGEDHML